MTSFGWSCLVWGSWLVLFLALEFTALLWHGCPWGTLSGTSWNLEDRWPPTRIAFLIFLAALLVHIVARIPLWIIARRKS